MRTDIIEKYNKFRLRDLGFKGLDADQQADKVLAEYRTGRRGIIAFYAESHRVMLIERKVWQCIKRSSLIELPPDASENLKEAARLLETAVEHELANPGKRKRKRRGAWGRKTWQRSKRS